MAYPRSTVHNRGMEMAEYHPAAEEEPDLRIVLLGKTGVGKSATGNTILGGKFFPSSLSFTSVTSFCEKKTNFFGSLNLAVIDTPGLFDTDKANEEVVKEIARCICMAAPGPHVFLIVLQPTRFTAEEEKTVEMIQKMFGEEAARYTMVLFTRGDELEEENTTIEELLRKHQRLESFVGQCSFFQKFENKYHVFNNKSKDIVQVSGLLQKIKRMVRANGGQYYGNEIFIEAQKASQVEIERLLRENPAINAEDARRQAERENTFIVAVLKAAAAGAASGVGVGAAVGTLGGPLGVAVGAGVGVHVGAAIGVALAVKNKGCIIQ